VILPIAGPQAGLLEHAVEGAGRNISRRLSRHGYRTRLVRMAKLPMASALPHLNPTIIFEGADEISHGGGHAYSMLAWLASGKRQRESAAADPATLYP